MTLEQIGHRCSATEQYHEQGCIEWLYHDFPSYRSAVKILDHEALAAIVHKDLKTVYSVTGPPMLHVCCRPLPQRRKIMQECLAMLQRGELCWWYENMETAPTRPAQRRGN